MLQQTISAGHRFDAESLIVGGSADTPPGVVGQEIDVASGAPWEVAPPEVQDTFRVLVATDVCRLQ